MQYRGAIINTHQDYSFSIHFCLQILFAGEVVDIYGVESPCYPATLLPWVPKVFSQPNMVRLSGEARSATMMCHGFVRTLILVLLCLETVSFGIISNTDGYVLISGKSQTAFPGKKIKYLIDRKTAIYHATIQHLLALFRKQCPLVAQA